MACTHTFTAAWFAVLLALPVSGLAAAPGPNAATPAPVMTMQGMETGTATVMATAPGRTATPTVPTEPGQGAFGALQQIVQILEADPHTDWSKVNLDALREHLIDMDRVTLDAHAVVRRIPGGFRATVSGTGRTLVAIQRLLPEEAMHLNRMRGWQVTATREPNGVILAVTTGDPNQVAMIRGLGFAGILASGNFHPMHHLEIARGEPMD
ncbi:MAG: hypothetical protein HIU82_14565 [Proteobacteria bacterium]|nr:hypothetical protein [Pseudomonadota bacterium]